MGKLCAYVSRPFACRQECLDDVCFHERPLCLGYPLLSILRERWLPTQELDTRALVNPDTGLRTRICGYARDQSVGARRKNAPVLAEKTDDFTTQVRAMFGS